MRTQEGRCRNIVKVVKILKNLNDFLYCSSDLALEAELLARLQHPHIIKIRGITHSGPAGFAQGAKGYFLIIDRLFETLDTRIRKWRAQSKPKSLRLPLFRRSSTGLSKRSTNAYSRMMDNRLTIALQIASAIKHLHSKNIMHRDIKVRFPHGAVVLFQWFESNSCTTFHCQPNSFTIAL